jgi:hypothetical protein
VKAYFTGRTLGSNRIHDFGVVDAHVLAERQNSGTSSRAPARVLVA